MDATGQERAETLRTTYSWRTHIPIQEEKLLPPIPKTSSAGRQSLALPFLIISQGLSWCRSLLVDCWCRSKSQVLETQGSKKEITILTISLNHSLTGVYAVYTLLHSSGPSLHKTKAQTTVTGKFQLLILEKMAKIWNFFFIVNIDDIIPTSHYF